MYGFKAFVFNGKKTASKAFDTLEDHTPVYAWIDDAAVVSKNKLGFTRIHSTWAQDDSSVGAGTGFGVVTGALLGSLLGPGGAAAGAAMGGVSGRRVRRGQRDRLRRPAVRRLCGFARQGYLGVDSGG